MGCPHPPGTQLKFILGKEDTQLFASTHSFQLKKQPARSVTVFLFGASQVNTERNGLSASTADESG